MRNRLLLLTVLGLSIFNCSSDNDNSPSEQLSDDIIVGRWELTHHESFGITINDTPCHQQSYIMWNSDFTGERETFANNGQGGPCFSTGAGEGTWEIISDPDQDENYRFIGNDGTTVEEEVVFVDDNTMYIDYGIIDFYYQRVE
ncbi:MAG: hypothetical protein Tsb0033_03230 [Winogradskyella sp.]